MFLLMRNPSILSATPSTRGAARRRARPGAPRGAALVFDACQIGVVLRAVLFVEAVVAVAALFLAPTPRGLAGAAGRP